MALHSSDTSWVFHAQGGRQTRGGDFFFFLHVQGIPVLCGFSVLNSSSGGSLDRIGRAAGCPRCSKSEHITHGTYGDLFILFLLREGREVFCSCTLLDLSKFVVEGIFVNGKRRGGFAVWVQFVLPLFCPGAFVLVVVVVVVVAVAVAVVLGSWFVCWGVRVCVVAWYPYQRFHFRALYKSCIYYGHLQLNTFLNVYVVWKLRLGYTYCGVVSPGALQCFGFSCFCGVLVCRCDVAQRNFCPGDGCLSRHPRRPHLLDPVGTQRKVVSQCWPILIFFYSFFTLFFVFMFG